MTVSAESVVKKQEFKSFGFNESESVNSFADLAPSNLKMMGANDEEKKKDFVNIFICHLIFYFVFCISLLLHILIDLGLGSFIKTTFNQFIRIIKSNVVVSKPAFA